MSRADEVITADPNAPTCPVCGAEPGEFCEAMMIGRVTHLDNHPERGA